MSAKGVFRRVAFVVAAALVTTLAASSTALGRSAVDDLSLSMGSTFATGPNQSIISTPAFPLNFSVSTDGGAQTITLRFSLPAGLRFNTTPGPAEGCTPGPPVVCRLEPTTNVAGSLVWEKSLGVIADAAGPYEVTGTVEGDRPDPNPANNTFTYRFEVRLPTTGGGGGGGGGAVSVSAGAVKLTPAKPKAGSAVVASTKVTANGSPVKPTKIVCTGTLAGRKLTGAPRAAIGLASCRYATRKTDKGKKLAGSMAIKAKGKTITKRFSARLG